MNWSLADMDRRLQGIVRIGRVTAVDATAAKARVSLGGESETAWLPWTAERAATINVWAPVAVGEQVVIVAPGGETNQGVIIGSLFSQDNPAESDDLEEHLMTLGLSSISVQDDQMTLDCDGSFVTITPDEIRLSCNGSTIVMDSSGIRLRGTRIDLN